MPVQPDLEAVRRKQAQLEAAYSAWIAEKAKYEILAFADQDDIVCHYPDGHTEVVYAAEKS
ncbi:hypothetical protein [Bergeriella denitrificans]|uniref:Uncharacterized protein n=1 Tax=Bergeriella denitrificans TaxID=494 RepID=A0A378UHH7_BERDE|nr:hypothetical protein [Bergeriella denitrificans]STZ75932.1 Uncharacterised protein [Bergeriella denitrificans]